MSSEIIPPPPAHHAHCPPPGTGSIQKMSEIDLPRSSISEWWYFNAHLSLVDGRKASAFIAFFRTNGSLEQTPAVKEGPLCHCHFLNFAISILPADSSRNSPSASSGLPSDVGQYHFTSAMDTEGAASILREVEAEVQMDPLLQRSLVEVMRNNKLPEPDSFIPGDVSISEEGNLNLKYGDLASVACRVNSQGEDVYHIVAQAADGSYGFEFDITPRKPPVDYGFKTDLLTGIPDDQMCYYFVPRCDVTGSLRVDNSQVEVNPNGSTGFYERKFGGGVRKLYRTGTKKIQRSWKWASVQLSNGWDLTIHTLWDIDVHSGDAIVRDSRAIAITPEGIHFECNEHSFEPVETWTSMNTLNDYVTKWKVAVPQLNLDISIEAAIVKQEFRTIAAGRGYWEGRVAITGTMDGKSVNGLGFVEMYPPQFTTKLEKYIKHLGRVTEMEVSKIYPGRLIDAQHALNTLVFHSDSNIAAIPTDSDYLSPLRFTQDIRLDTLHHHFFAPILHLTSRGGKCWRSFLGLACITAFGVDPEPFKPFLAATELIHAGELIIDDIEDESPMRRGVPTVHSLWGIPTAINAGTASYFAFDTAMRTMSESLRPQTTIVLYQLFFETMRAGHVGQCLDIAGQQQSDLDDILAGRVDPSILEKRIISSHRLKTAMVAANIARMSAAIAEASPAQTRALSIHFERVGIAFQIMDDVRDLRGSPYSGADIMDDPNATEIKPVLKRRGDDIRCGKFNIPIAKAGSMMPLNEAQWLWETVMRKTGDDDVTTQQVIDKLEAYGIVDTCVEEAHKMVNDSWANLEGHLKDSPAKVLLRALGWYLVKL